MDRRNFLRFLGAGLGVAAAPTKAYSFLGGIYRPRVEHFTLRWSSVGDITSSRHWELYVRSMESHGGIGAWFPISDVLREWVAP